MGWRRLLRARPVERGGGALWCARGGRKSGRGSSGAALLGAGRLVLTSLTVRARAVAFRRAWAVAVRRVWAVAFRRAWAVAFRRAWARVLRNEQPRRCRPRRSGLARRCCLLDDAGGDARVPASEDARVPAGASTCGKYAVFAIAKGLFGAVEMAFCDLGRAPGADEARFEVADRLRRDLRRRSSTSNPPLWREAALRRPGARRATTRAARSTRWLRLRREARGLE